MLELRWIEHSDGTKSLQYREEYLDGRPKPWSMVPTVQSTAAKEKRLTKLSYNGCVTLKDVNAKSVIVPLNEIFSRFTSGEFTIYGMTFEHFRKLRRWANRQGYDVRDIPDVTAGDSSQNQTEGTEP